MTEETNKAADESELLESVQIQQPDLERILDAEAVTFSDDALDEEKNDEYIYVYSGNALTPEELFHFTAREDAKLVLVAGPFSSGKTTLEIMLYRLFLEGYNQRVQFGGSVTLEGFRERSLNVLCSSGESEPVVRRTSGSAEDWFLHLALCEETRKKQNLLFADISGEIFTNNGKLQKISPYFLDNENVIIVVDGEKLCDSSKRNEAHFDTVLILKNLLSQGIVTNRTKLQIIYTKKDKIDESEHKELTLKFIADKQKNLQDQFDSNVMSLDFSFLSALSIEQKKESEELEHILLKCLEDVTVIKITTSFEDNHQLKRNFDKFQMRG